MNDLELKEDGVLYVVATPIGNLEDITFRAINVLKSADIIAAEDTRHTLKLLNFYNISKPLISYYRHNEDTKKDILINKILEGKNIALVSDAGTPGISDPGEEVVKLAIEKDIEIVPIPGACALINAVIASGISTKAFTFYGFLPLNKHLRKEKLEQIKKENKTVILYEAPHKLLKTLNDLYENLGNVKCTLAREITKIHEEFVRDDLEEIIKNIKEPKGEYVIILDLNRQEEKVDFSKISLEEHYIIYEKLGLSKKEIIKKIAKDRNVNKNEIYQAFINYPKEEE